MSSRYKTANLKLNSWIGSDKPKRADFNADNEIIDREFSAHINDTVSHITQQDRDNWSSFVQTGVYFGDGKSEKTIELNCDFDISCVIIFANNRPVSIVNFTDKRNYNYFAFACKTACTLGVKFSSDFKSIIVKQDATAQLYNEMSNMNELGVSYTYVMFR